MPSVNPIPFSEPRMQSANQQQPTGGDPFAELLASTAREDSPPRREPAAPKPRGEMRAENPGRKDVKETKSVSERREADEPTELKPQGGTETETPAEETEAGTDKPQTADGEATSTEPVVADAVEAPGEIEAAAETMELDGEGEAAEPVVQAEAEIPAGEGVDAADADALEMAKAPVVAATDSTPQAAAAQPQTVATAAPAEGEAPGLADKVAAPAPVAPDAEAPVEPVPAAGTPIRESKANDAKPAHAAIPATPATTEPGEGVTVPAIPATPATPAAKPTLTQGAPVADQQPAAQTAVAEAASLSPQGEGDNTSSQKQPDSSANQAKAQDVKPAPTAEAPKAPAPAQDAPAPKVQPQAMPEAVRAVTNSFNTANVQTVNFHATAINDRAPVPLNSAALAVEIVSRMNEGMRRFDIRLDPPELGRVDVRLEVDRAGNVTTKLTVDRPETLDLMQRDARHLERALQQAGLKTDGGGLEFSLRSHADQGGMADGQAGRGGRERGMTAGEDVERVELSIETYRSAAHARGGVDIRI